MAQEFELGRVLRLGDMRIGLTPFEQGEHIDGDGSQERESLDIAQELDLNLTEGYQNAYFGAETRALG